MLYYLYFCSTAHVGKSLKNGISLCKVSRLCGNVIVALGLLLLGINLKADILQENTKFVLFLDLEIHGQKVLFQSNLIVFGVLNYELTFFSFQCPCI